MALLVIHHLGKGLTGLLGTGGGGEVVHDGWGHGVKNSSEIIKSLKY